MSGSTTARNKCLRLALIEETEALLGKYGEAAGPLASLGYKQAGQFIRGELTREQACKRLNKLTVIMPSDR